MTDIRNLVSIRTVDAIEPIDGADRIEVAVVGGWRVVVAKEAFKEGESIVYFEIDSALPTDNPAFNFLIPRGVRPIEGKSYHVLKTIRLRGEYSQGLVLPLSDFDSQALSSDNLAEALGVVKYEKPAPAEMGKTAGAFPLDIVAKTDAERVQNLSKNWDKIVNHEAGWYATEKIDGCLKATTPVAMADGTNKAIRDIEVGDMVLGMDQFGQTLPTRVNGTKNEAPSGRWLKVRGERINRGRGHHTFSIKATDNHKFYVVDKGYVAAGELVPGDRVLCLHYDITPTLVQKSIAIGSLLGDGTLTGHGSLGFAHGTKQDDYHEWLIDALGPVVRGRRRVVSGYGSDVAHALCAVMHGWDTSAWDKPHGVIPESVVDDMNPIVAAVWYMDDGSLSHCEGQEDRARLATNSFNATSIDILQRALRKMGVDSTVIDAKGPTICLNAESADLFFALIAPYVPTSMQYKLPEYYRGCPGWMPQRTNGYRPVLSEVAIDSIDEVGKRFRKYDIETGTSNFFASGILVHNSSCTYIVDFDGSLRICTRNWEVQSEPGDMRTEVAESFGLPGSVEPGTVIQGELYGEGVQNNPLQIKGKRFAAFNVFKMHEDGPSTQLPPTEWPAAIAAIRVPVLDWELPSTIAEVVEQVDGMKSQIAPQRRAEGVVWHSKDAHKFMFLGNRACFKAISNAYLAKQKD